jgi:hypothetical protein
MNSSPSTKPKTTYDFNDFPMDFHEFKTHFHELKMDFHEFKLDYKILCDQISDIKRLLENRDEQTSLYLSVPEFAKKIGLTRSRVRQLCEEGRIKAIQINKNKGRWRILATEVKRLQLEAQSNHFNPKYRSRKILTPAKP